MQAHRSRAGTAATPRVSVLLPAFDAAATLGAALRSVARQTEPSFECVVVDDGSRDATLACALELAARDPRFHVLATPHRGLVGALGAGLRECRAPVVARMDADDLMHRRRLERQLALLDARPELAAVACHVRIFPRGAMSQGLREYERWLNAVDSPDAVRREAFVESPVVHPTLAVRGAVLRELGYRDRGWPEDYDLLLRLLAAGHAVGIVPQRLLCWRDHPARLTRTAEPYRIERFAACKAEFLAGGFLARGQDYVLWGYGHTGRAIRRALLAYGKRPSHVVEVHPGRLGNAIHGAPVVPPSELLRLPRRPIVASVAGSGPRGLVREALRAMGFRELDDFVCVA